MFLLLRNIFCYGFFFKKVKFLNPKETTGYQTFDGRAIQVNLQN